MVATLPWGVGDRRPPGSAAPPPTLVRRFVAGGAAGSRSKAWKLVRVGVFAKQASKLVSQTHKYLNKHD